MIFLFFSILRLTVNKTTKKDEKYWYNNDEVSTMVHWSSLYTVLAVSVTYLMEHVHIFSILDNEKKKIK